MARGRVNAIEPTAKRRAALAWWATYTYPWLVVMSISYASIDAWNAFWWEIRRAQRLFRDAFMESWEERDEG